MSKKTSIIISAVIAVALIIGGIFFFSKRDTPEDNIVVPETETSASAEPTTEQTAETTLPPAPETTAEAEEALDDLKEFEGITEVDNFSKEDVETILGYSSDYAYNSLTNAYFLSGQWYEEGMPNMLDDVVGHFFTSEIREDIKSFDTNPETGEDIVSKVAPLVFYVVPNDEVSPHPTCADETVSLEESKESSSTISCPLTGLEISDMKYEPTLSGETPGVKVTFSATAQIPLKMGEKDVYSEVRYDYVLNFINNDNYEETVNPNKFVINFYEVQINHGAVVDI